VSAWGPFCHPRKSSDSSSLESTLNLNTNLFLFPIISQPASLYLAREHLIKHLIHWHGNLNHTVLDQGTHFVTKGIWQKLHDQVTSPM
jgi:hypothetical protein